MKSFIGYSAEPSIRFKATSGGIGSSLLKWLFDKKIVETSISFYFNAEKLRFEPRIIHSFDDYEICGSIYQEIDLIRFVKLHLNEIKGGFACFALPCQARTIRHLVNKAGHKSIIIGLTCSSQQTIEATKYLLRKEHLLESNIANIQYRGNGWPSGIQIQLKDNSKIFINNNNSIWTQIFHSRLFIRNKCFKCQDTLNKFSDFTLADPWFKEFIQNEKIGKTLVFDNTKEDSLLERCYKDGYIVLEEIPENLAINSQQGTIDRKKSYRYNKRKVNVFFRIINNKLYRKLIYYSSFFKLHLFLKRKFENYLLRSLNK